MQTWNTNTRCSLFQVSTPSRHYCCQYNISQFVTLSPEHKATDMNSCVRKKLFDKKVKKLKERSQLTPRVIFSERHPICSQYMVIVIWRRSVCCSRSNQGLSQNLHAAFIMKIVIYLSTTMAGWTCTVNKQGRSTDEHDVAQRHFLNIIIIIITELSTCIFQITLGTALYHKLYRLMNCFFSCNTTMNNEPFAAQEA